MIAYLNGNIVKKSPTDLVLDVNGVGYKVNIPLSTFEKIGEVGNNVKILTYQYVREDVLALYGFVTEEERTLFELLLSVNGIGPKSALGILSGITVENFCNSILNEDTDILTNISGIGNKTARRLVVELKEKLAKEGLEKLGSLVFATKEKIPAEEEAILALVSLGYNRFEAKRKIEKIRTEDQKLSTEELIKKALKVAL